MKIFISQSMGGCRAGYDVARLYGIEINGEAS
nr:MAG TPA: hypothetical protein [Caudoviricetes sp.]